MFEARIYINTPEENGLFHSFVTQLAATRRLAYGEGQVLDSSSVRTVEAKVADAESAAVVAAAEGATRVFESNTIVQSKGNVPWGQLKADMDIVPAFPAEPVAAKAVPSEDDVVAAVRKFGTDHGIPKVRELLARFNVARATELAPEQRAAFLAATQEVTA